MRLNSEQAKTRFAASRVARLATIRPDGHPHLVPVVFAADRDVIYTAVDAKPKSTSALQRLANIAAHPDVAVLADHYDDDWTQLWWCRADGTAREADPQQTLLALKFLADKYSDYLREPPPGPVIEIQVQRWSGWAARDPDLTSGAAGRSNRAHSGASIAGDPCSPQPREGAGCPYQTIIKPARSPNFVRSGPTQQTVVVTAAWLVAAGCTDRRDAAGIRS